MKLTKANLICTFLLPFIFLPSITFAKSINRSHHDNLLPIGMPKIKNLKNIQSMPIVRLIFSIVQNKQQKNTMHNAH
jgi:hypothetical protein